MVVALDWQCRKVWATRLPRAANVMACVPARGRGAASVVLGCDDATVRVLDARGELTHRATLGSRPVAIRRLADAEGNTVIAVGTAGGDLATFRVSR
jgi:hypothetical protein